MGHVNAAKWSKEAYGWFYLITPSSGARIAPGRLLTLEQKTVFTYDANVLGGSYLGRLSKVEYGPDEGGGAPKYTEKYAYSVGGLPLEKRWDVREGTAVGSLTASWQYNNAGQLTRVTYPGGTYYAVSLDSMGRPAELKRDGTEWEVRGVGWNPAGQLTEMQRPSPNTSNPYNYFEYFDYNVRGQLTRSFANGNWNEQPNPDPNVVLEYTYPAANAGRISKMKRQFTDLSWNEEVEYSYDSLNRLALAATTAGSAVEWGLSFGFDGFGNRTSQTVTQGSGPTWSQAISTATNRVNAYSI